MKHRLLALILMTVFALSALVGCDFSSDKPSDEPDISTTVEPAITTTEPEITTTEPEITTTEPEFTTTEPEITTTEPDFTTTEPEITTTDAVIVTPPPTFVLTQESVCGDVDDIIYTRYMAVSEKSVLVPGLNQYMVPQGMDYWEEQDLLLISGYFTDTRYTETSVIVAVRLSTGEFVAEYFLKNIDGTNHDSHVGGVAVTGKNLFISSASKLYRIPLASLLAVNGSGEVRFVEEIAVPVTASFCNYSGGYLWVGEFYLPSSNYYCHESHTDIGWAVGYLLDEKTENELKAVATVSGSYATPDVILEIPQKIQGFTVLSNNKIVLSSSYGRTNNSNLYVYGSPFGKTAESSAKLNGKSIPVWSLNIFNCDNLFTALPMTEGVCTVGSKLCTLYESGADKYLNGGGKNPTDCVWLSTIN